MSFDAWQTVGLVLGFWLMGTGGVLLGMWLHWWLSQGDVNDA